MEFFHTKIRFSRKADERKAISVNIETKRHINTAKIFLEKAWPGMEVENRI